MMTRPGLLSRRLRHFWSDDRGTISIETLFMLPLLCWAYVGTLLFFDAFRDQAATEKATYTIADMVTREVEPMTPIYFSQLHRMHRFLTSASETTTIRVTAFSYDEDNDQYIRHWSVRRGPNSSNLTQADMNGSAWSSHVPLMYDGEVLVAVETWSKWSPWVDIGLPDLEFNSFVVTRPRYAPQVCFHNNNDGVSGTTFC